MLSTLTIATSKKRQLVDITNQVEKIVYQSKAKEGCVLIFARHTTCSIVITEVEDNLETDIIRYLEKEGPKGPFGHNHGDILAHDPRHADKSHTPSHILSAIIGQSTLIPIDNGQLLLGTWQRICVLELDGPRIRKVIMRISQ